MLLVFAGAFNVGLAFVGRIGFGACESPNFPACTKLATHWTPTVERARAVSFLTLGVPVGVAIGPPLIGLLVGAVGWRPAFVLIALFGSLWVLASIWILRDTPRQSRWASASEVAMIEDGERQFGSARESQAAKVSWRAILTSKSLWAVGISGSCAGYLNYMATTWLPTYFRTSFNFNLSSSAFLAAIPWVGAAVGMVAAGVLSDRIVRRGGSMRLARGGVLGTGMILAGAFLVLAAESHVLWLSVLALFLPMAFDFPAVSGISYSTVPSLFPATAVAKATGAFMVLGSLSGLGGPYVTGFLVGQQGGFSLALLTAASVVAVGGVVALVGIRPRDLEVKRSGIGASASARSLFREFSHPARGRPTRRKCGLFLD